MKELFQKIIEVLTSAEGKAAFEAAGLPPVVFIDTYKEQYLHPEDFEVFPLPSIFMGWNIVYDKETKSREGLAAVDIYLVYEQLRDTSNISATQAEALKYFDMLDLLYELLGGLSTSKTGPLTVADEGTQDESGIENVYKFMFYCTFSGRVTPEADKWNYTDGTGKPDLAGSYIVKPFGNG